MPKVGDKHFAYTAKGKKAAAEEAKKVGKTVTKGRKKSKAKRSYATDDVGVKGYG
tara:strand:- start:59 stop:223 length:165 start_codon:yes stop_codon:yes gene_type:complete